MRELYLFKNDDKDLIFLLEDMDETNDATKNKVMLKLFICKTFFRGAGLPPRTEFAIVNAFYLVKKDFDKIFDHALELIDQYYHIDNPIRLKNFIEDFLAKSKSE